MSTPALELTGLKKSFGKAEIIRGIDLSIGKAVTCNDAGDVEGNTIIGSNTDAGYVEGVI